MITAFKPDANTTVTLVKAFKQGDPLALAGTPASPPPPIAANDMCLVKLTIGPGNPGPAGALSTSSGIHIEMWLPSPANWNKRVHNITLGGFGGNAIIGNTSLITAGTAPFLTGVTWGIAMNEGAVSAVNDGGHADPAGTGSFAMNPNDQYDAVDRPGDSCNARDDSENQSLGSRLLPDPSIVRLC
jgi:feruloyl esterase